MVDLVAVIVVASAALLQVSTAKTHAVGDNLGLIVPVGGVLAYSDWASQHKFMLGDILVFSFTTRHSMATVSKDDFDACNTNDAISVKLNGPANYTLSTGDTYFICLVDDHCVQGQQLAITAFATTTGSPSPKSFLGDNTHPPLVPVQGSSATRPTTAIAAPFLISISLTSVSIYIAN